MVLLINYYFPGKNLKPNPLSSGLTENLLKNIYFIPYGDIETSKNFRQN